MDDLRSPHDREALPEMQREVSEIRRQVDEIGRAVESLPRRMPRSATDRREAARVVFSSSWPAKMTSIWASYEARRRWRLPLIALTLWLVVGVIAQGKLSGATVWRALSAGSLIWGIYFWGILAVLKFRNNWLPASYEALDDGTISLSGGICSEAPYPGSAFS